MWPFKKKQLEPEPAPTPKKTLKYKTIQVNVGKAFVRIELEDGSKLLHLIYGNAYQYKSTGDYIYYQTTFGDPYAHPVCIQDIDKVSKDYLNDLPYYSRTHGLADYRDEYTRHYSPIKKAIVDGIEDHIIEFQEAYIVEVTNETK